MNLAAQILRQIDNPDLGYAERAWLRCRLAKELTELGDHEAARDAMGPLWSGAGERPALDNLDGATAAEVLLRAGVLSGLIGSIRQIEGSQEIAKDLISESKRKFEELGEKEKVAEAQIDLAVCYWREGSFDEARVILQEALSCLADGASEQRARALINSAMIEISMMRFNDALRHLVEARPLFDVIDNHVLQGNFHNQFALTLKKLSEAEHREDYSDNALIEYTAASYHYEQAGHVRYRAAVENNLGYLLFIRKRIAEAHEHLDHARSLFIGLKDSVHTAQVDETRARVLLAQGRSAEAERVARAAVRTLERGDESSLLAEALTTHGVALSRLGNYQEARAALNLAVDVAEKVGDRESAGLAAITVMEELGARLAIDELQAMYERADSLLINSQNTDTLRRLRACARRAVDAARVRACEFAAPDFVHADERTKELLRTAHLVAGTQAPVLITGETGTGKEVLARLIHHWSGRAGQFVALNCEALTETLFESLLFGQARGSFTDEAQEHLGAVREAARGTLFLNGIAELSFGSQGKLLRLIERGEIHSTGVPLPEHVDVRIVAATNCDLEQMVARGEFRADLFYRLNTFHLVIPPLRERPDDIPALATYFIEELLKTHPKQVTFLPEAVEAMRKLPLKGNARELRALIERTLLTANDGAVITPYAVEALAIRRLVSKATLTDPWEGCSLKAEVHDFESNLIGLALQATGGGVTQAARLLGVTHQRLCAMLKARHKNLIVAKKGSLPRKPSVIRKLAH
jgi:DNA-binding NtrC family response regulator